MDADDDFYSGTENYSDYADSDADDADYEFVEDDADDSDDLIFRRRQVSPPPIFFDLHLKEMENLCFFQ